MANSVATQRLDELTYEREDIFDISINLKTLEHNCPLARSSSTEGSNTASFQLLGQLDLLPLEIIQTILRLLDLHTLTLMQSLNRRSKFLIDSLPQHRELVTHAPNALRAILSTGLAPHFSIQHLSRALRAQECFQCGLFGSYLYLPDCRRCCWLCLAEASSTLPMSIDSARDDFGVPDSAFRQLPCMRSLPGRYTGLGTFPGDTNIPRVALVSMNAVKEVVIAGVEAETDPNRLQEARDTSEASPRAAQAAAQPAFSAKLGTKTNSRRLRRRLMQHPNRKDMHGSFKIYYGKYQPRRFMAAIRFPTLDLLNGTLEWGLSCKGCRDGPPNDDESRDWEVMYTKRGYLTHFDQCKWSQGLLASLETDG